MKDPFEFKPMYQNDNVVISTDMLDDISVVFKKYNVSILMTCNPRADKGYEIYDILLPIEKKGTVKAHIGNIFDMLIKCVDGNNITDANIGEILQFTKELYIPFLPNEMAIPQKVTLDYLFQYLEDNQTFALEIFNAVNIA